MKPLFTPTAWASLLLTMAFLCLLTPGANATHIRAGEILYRHVGGFTYEIILRGYADRDSQVIFGSNGTLDFGDGSSLQINNDGSGILRTAISSDTWMYELKMNHTYPSARTYTVSFREFYRNEGVLNIDNSLQMPFYIESVLTIDPFLGVNNSPILSLPPIDIATAGTTYHHQPGATDPDGDSLTYRLVVTRQDKTVPVSNYRFPHLTFPAGDTRNGTNESGGSPYLIINPFTGDVVWDAPAIPGEYNLTLVVEDWRKVDGQFYKMGAVARDMLIIVEEETVVPELDFPISGESVAPAEGEPVSWTISATAPTPEDSVELEIWGDFVARSGASLSKQLVRAKGQASITISWTGEEDVDQHYQLIAKAYNPQTPQYARARSAYIYRSSGPLGVSEKPYTPVQLFPNPLQGTHFYLELPTESSSEVAVKVYDVKGRLVQESRMISPGKQLPVQLKAAIPGLYIIHLHQNGRLYRSKLVVQ